MLALVAVPSVLTAACGRVDYELIEGRADASATDGQLGDAGALSPEGGTSDAGTAPNDGGVSPLWTNVRLTSTPVRSSGPAIAAGGGTYCVTWTEASASGFDAYARIYDMAFAPLSAEIRLSPAGTSAEVPVPVHDGTGWGVFWLEVAAMTASVVGAEIDAMGSIVTPATALTGATSIGGNVTVAFDGSDYWIAWGDSRYGGAEVIAARVSRGLGSTTEVRVSNATGLSYFPAIAWNGSLLGVAWGDNRSGDYEIYFTTVDAGVLGTEVRVTTTTGISLLPALASGGSGFGLAWNEGSSGTDQIRFAHIASGTVSAETVLSGPASTLYPSIAYAGDRFAVVWGDDRDGARRVYGASATPGGSTSAIPVAEPGAASSAPWIASDGSFAAVVWEDARHGESEIYAARGRFE